MMIDLTWQLEAIASIAVCIGLGVVGRRLLGRLDRKQSRR